jgi:hypothetical protein
MSEEILLVVNGKRHTVQAAEDTPLLYVLRNELGLTGPQFGCGEETYGACMVLIGDHAKPSCSWAQNGAIGKSYNNSRNQTSPGKVKLPAARESAPGFSSTHSPIAYIVIPEGLSYRT